MDPHVASLAAQHLSAGKYFQVAAFAMLVYDHALTFSQEVERIWNHRISIATVLFVINRYATLMQFIVVVTAFNDAAWVGEPCRRFVLFEGTTTVGLIAVGQLIMILRVFAIYDRNKRILVVLLSLWLGQIVISAVGLRTGYPAPLPKGLVGCILTGRDTLFPSVWISPLITDSVIFFLTIYRTKHYIHHVFTPFMSPAAAKAIMILVRDGTMYFFLIFLSNLMNALIFFLADPDLKAIGASFSQLLTCTMVSRLVLNLRSISNENNNFTTMDGGDEEIVFHSPFSGRRGIRRGRRETTSIWSKAIEDLGVHESFDDDGAIPRIQVTTQVTTEVVCDVPLERLDSRRRANVKTPTLV